MIERAWSRYRGTSTLFFVTLALGCAPAGEPGPTVQVKASEATLPRSIEFTHEGTRYEITRVDGAYSLELYCRDEAGAEYLCTPDSWPRFSVTTYLDDFGESYLFTSFSEPIEPIAVEEGLRAEPLDEGYAVHDAAGDTGIRLREKGNWTEISHISPDVEPMYVRSEWEARASEGSTIAPVALAPLAAPALKALTIYLLTRAGITFGTLHACHVAQHNFAEVCNKLWNSHIALYKLQLEAASRSCPGYVPSPPAQTFKPGNCEVGGILGALFGAYSFTGAECDITPAGPACPPCETPTERR